MGVFAHPQSVNRLIYSNLCVRSLLLSSLEAVVVLVGIGLVIMRVFCLQERLQCVLLRQSRTERFICH